MIALDLNDGASVGFLLAFAFPAVLFWIGVVTGNFKVAVAGIVSGTFALTLTLLLGGILGWAGIEVTTSARVLMIQAFSGLGMMIIYLVLRGKTNDLEEPPSI